MAPIGGDPQKSSCFSDVSAHTSAPSIHHAKSALRAGASLIRRLLEASRSFPRILADATAAGVHEAKSGLCFGDALIRRFQKPFPCLGRVPWRAGALVKNMTKMSLSSGVALGFESISTLRDQPAAASPLAKKYAPEWSAFQLPLNRSARFNVASDKSGQQRENEIKPAFWHPFAGWPGSRP